LTGWPSRSLFDYNYQPLDLTELEFQFLQACEGQPSKNVGELLAEIPLDLNQVRQLQQRQLLILAE
jgi:hypothetical protein